MARWIKENADAHYYAVSIHIWSGENAQLGIADPKERDGRYWLEYLPNDGETDVLVLAVTKTEKAAINRAKEFMRFN